MASRSSSGIGVGITITLLGVLSLALFILTIVFYSKYQASNRQLISYQTEQDQYILRDEMSGDAVARIKDLAKTDRKSVVGYLLEATRMASQRVTGSGTDTPAQMFAKLDRVEGASSNNLLGVLASKDAQIADLGAKLAQADADRRTALQDLANESERVKRIQETHQKTIASLNGDLDKYRAEVEQYRASVNDAKMSMDRQIEKTRDDATAREAALAEKVRKLEGDNVQLLDRISKLQGEKTRDILKPLPESAHVDGQIMAINPAAQEITINRGLADKIILGMSFAVYSDATAIRPDPKTGEYPAGKATVEVINVGQSSSVCRVTSEVKGSPIVRGDVVANAIYDPNKVYTFLIDGNFDTNRDGVATPREADDIRALITSWGGKVVDDLSGNVDFLVLGARPVLPPRPDVRAPIALVQEYMRLDALAQRYDRLFEQAVATSLPVLNENRLYTLIGRRAGSR
ncbi:MAG: hypothetical protein JNM80_00410 [Phycisphaerae bacterium]|nr:hypothetical protein [Phycisphaerae bacterium]